MSRRHAHDMQPVDVYPLPVTGMAAIGGTALPRTVVLMRCGCGSALATTVLTGRWTIGQVQGSAAPAPPPPVPAGGGAVRL